MGYDAVCADMDGQLHPDVKTEQRQLPARQNKGGTMNVQWQHTGIQDVFRLRRLQVRRGAGRPGQQRRAETPHVAALRCRAGRHSGDDGWQRNMLFPPRCQQECHAEYCFESSNTRIIFL